MGDCARCGHAGLNHDIGGDCSDRECSCSGYKFTPAPSPARDDAEEAIAGLLAEHTPMHLQAAQGPDGLVWECCTEVVGPYELEGEELETAYRAHVASVIASHMAAPDELTAQDILHRINMQTSLGSVFGSQTEPDNLYMPTALVCRLLDGEDA